MREWLKDIRVEKGFTQQQVADAVGITLQYYYYIEKGDRCRPEKIKHEKKIADVLGFNWVMFFEDSSLLTHQDSQII